MEYKFWKIEDGKVFYRSQMLKRQISQFRNLYSFDVIKIDFDPKRWKKVSPSAIMFIKKNPHYKKKALCDILDISLYKLNHVKHLLNQPYYL